ncbi:non-receptor tyrosine-protein kinase TYK2-like [Triticum urartu]|uniref:non-receptor tyrosine-protein kinase TYK2-like n=1 Tax=Triticum urartu TaxID=4572 RepID=UPI002042F3EE|nr:non-receptor tyrosine-protein kinase TYK2-like [Triticum urartu]
MDLRESTVTEMIQRDDRSKWLSHNNHNIKCFTEGEIRGITGNYETIIGKGGFGEVIHDDIKPANILLDDNFNAKISDFGISRLVNTDSTLFTEHVMGSIGYMDPLFAGSGRLTWKSDVYSFGIVLVEFITKKKATIRNGEAGIVECFTQALATGKRKVRELFDLEISSQNNMKVLEGVAKLAGQCLRMEMDRRPEMIDVAESLRALRKTQVQGKQTIFPWGWRNKSAAQNNWQSSSSVTPQSLPSNLCRHFSLREMKSATGNFAGSHIVGQGGSGIVYYGMIDAGATKVAIKRGIVKQDVSMFQTEIAMMAKLRHHHLVSLVGYCKEKNERILIYDYMARGTLRENLYANKTEEPPLTWRQRLDVCIGAARALHYLHECSVIPNDVSTTNILLDERLVGKVPSEVSMWRYDTDDTYLIGCPGFHDPDFSFTGQLTEESSVYSFGVVLSEVLCARAAWDPYLVQCALSWDDGKAPPPSSRIFGRLLQREKPEILIYDYMARGTLSENLYANKTEEPPLTWRQRLDVCIGAARALHYLHECSIISNDVSTTNILLDEKLVGKLSSTVSQPQDTMKAVRLHYYCVLSVLCWLQFSVG